MADKIRFFQANKAVKGINPLSDSSGNFTELKTSNDVIIPEFQYARLGLRACFIDTTINLKNGEELITDILSLVKKKDSMASKVVMFKVVDWNNRGGIKDILNIKSNDTDYVTRKIERTDTLTGDITAKSICKAESTLLGYDITKPETNTTAETVAYLGATATANIEGYLDDILNKNSKGICKAVANKNATANTNAIVSANATANANATVIANATANTNANATANAVATANTNANANATATATATATANTNATAIANATANTNANATANAKLYSAENVIGIIDMPQSLNTTTDINAIIMNGYYNYTQKMGKVIKVNGFYINTPAYNSDTEIVDEQIYKKYLIDDMPLEPTDDIILYKSTLNIKWDLDIQILSGQLSNIESKTWEVPIKLIAYYE